MIQADAVISNAVKQAVVLLFRFDFRRHVLIIGMNPLAPSRALASGAIAPIGNRASESDAIKRIIFLM